MRGVRWPTSVAITRSAPAGAARAPSGRPRYRRPPRRPRVGRLGRCGAVPRSPMLAAESAIARRRRGSAARIGAPASTQPTAPHSCRNAYLDELRSGAAAPADVVPSESASTGRHRLSSSGQRPTRSSLLRSARRGVRCPDGRVRRVSASVTLERPRRRDDSQDADAGGCSRATSATCADARSVPRPVTCERRLRRRPFCSRRSRRPSGCRHRPAVRRLSTLRRGVAASARRRGRGRRSSSARATHCARCSGSRCQRRRVHACRARSPASSRDATLAEAPAPSSTSSCCTSTQCFTRKSGRS